jgi:hypothetical protein
VQHATRQTYSAVNTTRDRISNALSTEVVHVGRLGMVSAAAANALATIKELRTMESARL